MADIRINALPTTASASSSDDYIALDGTTNGTRKLSAYSPTFGGNLTVSGTGNSTVAGNLGIGESSPVVPLHIKTTGTGTGNFDNAIATLRSTAAGRTITLQFSDTTNQSYISSKSGALNFGVGGATLGMSLSSGGNLTVSGASYNDFAGALWLGTTAGYGTLNVGNVSGTGTATYSCLTLGDQSTPANATGIYMRGTSAVCGISTAGAPIAFFTGGPGTLEAARFFNNGNFGIGTTTDSGNGKLQLATHTASTGGIGFGTDLSFYRSNSDALTSYSSGTANNFFLRHSTTSAGGFQVQIDSSKDVYLFQRENRPMYIGTNNTTALTLDSSQNATFAGQALSSVNAATATNLGSFVASNATLNAFVTYTSGASADQKYWSWQSGSAVGDGVFRLRALNDAGTSGKNAIVVKRTGISSVIVNLPSLPTSSAGLAAGDLWNDSGTVKVV